MFNICVNSFVLNQTLGKQEIKGLFNQTLGKQEIKGTIQPNLRKQGN